MAINPYTSPFDSADALSTYYDEERADNADTGVFGGSFESGIHGLGSSFNNTLAALGRVAGADQYAAQRERAADIASQRAAGAAHMVPTFEQALEDPTDAGAGWGMGAVGSNLPLMGVMIGSGLAGGTAGARLAGRGGLVKSAGMAARETKLAAMVEEAMKLKAKKAPLPQAIDSLFGTTRRATESEVLQQPGSSAVLDFAANLGRSEAEKKSMLSNIMQQGLSGNNRTARYAGMATGALPYLGTTVGETYGRLRNDPEAEGELDERALGAIGSGAAQTGLGLAFQPLGIMQRVGLARNPMAALGVSMLGEGATEAGEQLIQQATHNQFNPNAGYDPLELVEAGLAGALVGGATGVLPAAAQSMHQVLSSRAAAEQEAQGEETPEQTRERILSTLEASDDPKQKAIGAALRAALAEDQAASEQSSNDPIQTAVAVVGQENFEARLQAALKKKRKNLGRINEELTPEIESEVAQELASQIDQERARLDPRRQELEAEIKELSAQDQNDPNVRSAMNKAQRQLDGVNDELRRNASEPRASTPINEDAPDYQLPVTLRDKFGKTRNDYAMRLTDNGYIEFYPVNPNTGEPDTRTGTKPILAIPNTSNFDHPMHTSQTRELLSRSLRARDDVAAIRSYQANLGQSSPTLSAGLNRLAAKLDDDSRISVEDLLYVKRDDAPKLSNVARTPIFAALVGPELADTLKGEFEALTNYQAQRSSLIDNERDSGALSDVADLAALDDLKQSYIEANPDATDEEISALDDVHMHKKAPTLGLDAAGFQELLTAARAEQATALGPLQSAVDQVRASQESVTGGSRYRIGIRPGRTPNSDPLLTITDTKTRRVIEIPSTVNSLLSDERILFRGVPIRAGQMKVRLAEALANKKPIDIQKLFDDAQVAYEYRSTSRPKGRVTANTYPNRKPEYEFTEDEEELRVNPQIAKYGIIPVKLYGNNPNAAMHKAIEIYGPKGYVVLGKMDNQVFFATKEARKQFILDHKLSEELFGDLNLIERIGTLLKKESGDSHRYHVGDIVARHGEVQDTQGNTRHMHDGLMMNRRGVRTGQGVMQREITTTDEAGNRVVWTANDKGIVRSTIIATEVVVDENGRITKLDPSKDENGNVIQERESLNQTLQLGKKLPSAFSEDSDLSPYAEVAYMRPVAQERGGTGDQQQISFGVPSEAATQLFFNDTLAMAEKNPEDLLSPEDAKRHAVGTPIRMLMDIFSFMNRATKIDAKSERAYVFSTDEQILRPVLAQQDSEQTKSKIKEAFDKIAREYRPSIDDVMLMPNTYMMINKLWRRQQVDDKLQALKEAANRATGEQRYAARKEYLDAVAQDKDGTFTVPVENLKNGDVVLLSRGPALPDGSNMAPFVFRGVSRLDTPEGTHGLGVVVHTLNENWKEMAGDFDGDVANIMIPNKLLFPKPTLKWVVPGTTEPLSYSKPKGAKKQPIAAEAVKFGLQVDSLDQLLDMEYVGKDLLSYLSANKYTEFSQMIGRIIRVAQSLAEINMLEALVEIPRFDPTTGKFIVDSEGAMAMVQAPWYAVLSALGQDSIHAKKKAVWEDTALFTLFGDGDTYPGIFIKAQELTPRRVDPTTNQVLYTSDAKGNEIPQKDKFFSSVIAAVKRAPMRNAAVLSKEESDRTLYSRHEDYGPQLTRLVTALTEAAPTNQNAVAELASLAAHYNKHFGAGLQANDYQGILAFVSSPRRQYDKNNAGRLTEQELGAMADITGSEFFPAWFWYRRTKQLYERINDIGREILADSSRTDADSLRTLLGEVAAYLNKEHGTQFDVQNPLKDDSMMEMLLRGRDNAGDRIFIPRRTLKYLNSLKSLRPIINKNDAWRYARAQAKRILAVHRRSMIERLQAKYEAGEALHYNDESIISAVIKHLSGKYPGEVTDAVSAMSKLLNDPHGDHQVDKWFARLHNSKTFGHPMNLFDMFAYRVIAMDKLYEATDRLSERSWPRHLRDAATLIAQQEHKAGSGVLASMEEVNAVLEHRQGRLKSLGSRIRELDEDVDEKEIKALQRQMLDINAATKAEYLQGYISAYDLVANGVTAAARYIKPEEMSALVTESKKATVADGIPVFGADSQGNDVVNRQIPSGIYTVVGSSLVLDTPWTKGLAKDVVLQLAHKIMGAEQADAVTTLLAAASKGQAKVAVLVRRATASGDTANVSISTLAHAKNNKWQGQVPAVMAAGAADTPANMLSRSAIITDADPDNFRGVRPGDVVILSNKYKQHVDKKTGKSSTAIKWHEELDAHYRNRDTRPAIAEIKDKNGVSYWVRVEKRIYHAFHEKAYAGMEQSDRDIIAKRQHFDLVVTYLGHTTSAWQNNLATLESPSEKQLTKARESIKRAIQDYQKARGLDVQEAQDMEDSVVDAWIADSRSNPTLYYASTKLEAKKYNKMSTWNGVRRAIAKYDMLLARTAESVVLQDSPVAPATQSAPQEQPTRPYEKLTQDEKDALATLNNSRIEQAQELADAVASILGRDKAPKILNAQEVYNYSKKAMLDGTISYDTFAARVAGYLKIARNERGGSAKAGLFISNYDGQGAPAVFVAAGTQTQKEQLGTLVHELGHYITVSEYAKLRDNDKATADALWADYANWAQTNQQDANVPAFYEWMADNAGAYLLRSPATQNKTGTWFKELAATFLRTYNELRNRLRRAFGADDMPLEFASVNTWLGSLFKELPQQSQLIGTAPQSDQKDTITSLAEKYKHAMDDGVTEDQYTQSLRELYADVRKLPAEEREALNKLAQVPDVLKDKDSISYLLLELDRIANPLDDTTASALDYNLLAELEQRSRELRGHASDLRARGAAGQLQRAENLEYEASLLEDQIERSVPDTEEAKLKYEEAKTKLKRGITHAYSAQVDKPKWLNVRQQILDQLQDMSPQQLRSWAAAQRRRAAEERKVAELADHRVSNLAGVMEEEAQIAENLADQRAGTPRANTPIPDGELSNSSIGDLQQLLGEELDPETESRVQEELDSRPDPNFPFNPARQLPSSTLSQIDLPTEQRAQLQESVDNVSLLFGISPVHMMSATDMVALLTRLGRPADLKMAERIKQHANGVMRGNNRQGIDGLHIVVNGEHYIYVSSALDEVQMGTVLGHELGHGIVFDELGKLRDTNNDLYKKIIAAYKAERKKDPETDESKNWTSDKPPTFDDRRHTNQTIHNWIPTATSKGLASFIKSQQRRIETAQKPADLGQLSQSEYESAQDLIDLMHEELDAANAEVARRKTLTKEWTDDFHEWIADQVRNVLVGTNVTKNIGDTWFRQLASKLRRFFEHWFSVLNLGDPTIAPAKLQIFRNSRILEKGVAPEVVGQIESMTNEQALAWAMARRSQAQVDLASDGENAEQFFNEAKIVEETTLQAMRLGNMRREPSVEKWIRGIAKNESQLERAYGPALNSDERLTDRLQRRKIWLDKWAENPNAPNIEALNILAPQIRDNLGKLLSPQDVAMLRREVHSAAMKKRLVQLLSPNTEALDAVENNSDMSVAYFYALTSAGVMRPTPAMNPILNRLTQSLRLANRATLEATSDEVNEIIGSLNLRGAAVPNEAPRPLLTPDMPAARLYAERAQRFGRGVLGNAQRMMKGYSDATAWIIDVAHRRILRTGVPEFMDLSGMLQQQSWELFGLKRPGMFIRQLVEFQRYMGGVAEVVGEMPEADRDLLKQTLYPFSGGAPKVPENVAVAKGKLRKILNSLYDYAQKNGLEFDKRENYWPMVLNKHYIQENLDSVIQHFTADKAWIADWDAKGNYVQTDDAKSVGWGRVRNDYINWILENKDAGKEADVTAAVNRISSMKLNEFVREYLVADNDHSLPGWRIEALGPEETNTYGFRYRNPRELDFLLHSSDAATHANVVATMDPNPVDTINRYIRSITKRAEHEHTMKEFFQVRGYENGWKDFWEAAKRSGATDKDIKLMVNYISAIHGMMGIESRDKFDRLLDKAGKDSILQSLKSDGKIMNDKLNFARSWAIAWINASHLTLTAFTAMQDLVVPLVRDDANAKRYTQAISNLIQQSGPILKRLSPEKREQLERRMRKAAMVGAASTFFRRDDIMATHVGSDITPGAQKFQEWYFWANRVQMMSDGASSIADTLASLHIEEHAKAAKQGDQKSIEALRYLGLTPEDVVLDQHGEILIRSVWEVDDISAAELERDTRVRAAMHTFVMQAQVRPNATNRTLLMSDPYFSLVTLWRGYIVGYDNDVLNPMFAKLTQNGNMTPLVASVLVFVPIMMFSELLRDGVRNLADGEDDDEPFEVPQWKKDWSWAEHAGYAFRKAGFFGRGEIVSEVAAGFIEGGPREAVSQLTGVVGSDVNKYLKWGQIPIPGSDWIKTWG